MDQAQFYGLNVAQVQARAPLVARFYFLRVQLFGMKEYSLARECQTPVGGGIFCACYLKKES